VVDAGDGHSRLAQAILDRRGRESGPVFDAAEPLLLGRGDELAVDDDRRGGIGMVGIDA
jgi:hypothetical protein